MFRPLGSRGSRAGFHMAAAFAAVVLASGLLGASGELAMPGTGADGTPTPLSDGASARAEFLGVSKLFPRVYYPGVESPAQAHLFELAPGDSAVLLQIPMLEAGVQVRGRILGQGEGPDLPLTGALVQWMTGDIVIEGLTDAEGTYTLEGVPIGAGLLRVATDDPRSRARDHRAIYWPGVEQESSAEPIEVDGLLEEIPDLVLPIGARMSGAVLTGDTGLPIADAPVEVTRLDAPGAWDRRTGPAGGWSLAGLAPGQYRVRADVAGSAYIPEYLGGSREPEAATVVDLGGGDAPADLDIRPDLGGVITGWIRNESGQPLSGVRVETWDRAVGSVYTDETDVLGFHRIEGLPGGTYILFVPLLNRFFPDEIQEEDARPIQVVEGAASERVDVSGLPLDGCGLGTPGVIRGLVEADFDRISRVTVRALSQTDTFEVAIEDRGLYVIECVADGDYIVSAVPDGPVVRRFYPDSFDLDGAEFVTVDGDTADQIDFVLEPGVRFRGDVVVDPGGQPLPGVAVRAEDPTGAVRARTQTGGDGMFLLDRIDDGSGIPAGFYRVAAESIVVPDPDVTPVLRPTFTAAAEDDRIRLRWTLSPEVGWRYRIVRFPVRPGASGEPILEAGEPVRNGDLPPGAALEHEAVDPAVPVGRLRYRLDATALEQPEVPFELWSEVIERSAGPQEPARIVAAPTPWSGRGPVRLKLAGGTSRPPEAAEVEIFAADGRRVHTVPWQEDGAIVDARAAAGLASGVYYLRLRDTSDQEHARGVLVVGR